MLSWKKPIFRIPTRSLTTKWDERKEISVGLAGQEGTEGSGAETTVIWMTLK